MSNAFETFSALPSAPISGDPLVREFAAAYPNAAADGARAASDLALACLRPLSAGYSPAAAAALASRIERELENEASPEAAAARKLEQTNRRAFAELAGLKTEKG